MATGISRLSFETYKSWESVRCVFAHNHRLSGNPNSDPAKAGWNVVLKGSPADDLESLCLKRIAADSDPRANPMAGIVLGVSPGFFRPGRTGSGGDFCPERVRAWARAAHGWAEGRFGDNLVSSVLHLDEITPHIHLLVLPLDADGKLRMTALLKGRNCLSELHSGYAWALSGLGVERPSRWQLRFDGKLERNYYPFVRALALAGPPPTPEPEEPGSPRAQPLLGPPVPEPSLEGRPPPSLGPPELPVPPVAPFVPIRPFPRSAFRRRQLPLRRLPRLPGGGGRAPLP
ncbi:MAG: plasmid recombination protein [Deltaproteobacteria bacterium]|jgi:hypothetical protein|nr:plasmid recombination protein [Deltaproteobacteria bacterium]